MPDDGLEYLPDGLREGGRGSYLAADEADEAQRHLRSVQAEAAAWGGAVEFTAAVNQTRDVQARSVERGAEDREALAEGALHAADIGEVTDAEAAVSARLGATSGSSRARGVADGMSGG